VKEFVKLHAQTQLGILRDDILTETEIRPVDFGTLVPRLNEDRLSGGRPAESVGEVGPLIR
jgi:hypothetical protein